MKINNIKIDDWDGVDYVVLHQVTGFYFSERRFNQGILTDDYCFLFKKDTCLDTDLIQQILDVIKKRNKKEDDGLHPTSEEVGIQPTVL